MDLGRLTGGGRPDRYLRSIGFRHLDEVSTQAGPHGQDREGWTLLHHVIEDVRREVCNPKLLPLACKKVKQRLLEVRTGSKQQPPDMTAVHQLVKMGGGHERFKEEALHVLLNRGCDPGLLHPKSGNALHICVGVGARWALRGLLSAGVQLNVPNSWGQWHLDCIGRTRDGRPTNARLYSDLVQAGCRHNPHYDHMPGRRDAKLEGLNREVTYVDPITSRQISSAPITYVAPIRYDSIER